MDTITIHNPRLINEDKARAGDVWLEVNDLSQVFDGYHTIQELYDHRITLYIALCRSQQNWFKVGFQHVAEIPGQMPVWRSRVHSDGSSFDGWFIMGIGKTLGNQISYHIPLDRWKDTDFAETFDRAPEWDEHSSKEVLERLERL